MVVKVVLVNLLQFFLDSEQSDECIDFKMMCVLDSERSDECIDFTMIITSKNNASISNFEGGFLWKSEYPWCIIEVKRFSNSFQKKSRKTIKKKKDGKTGIFTQNQFSAKSIFLYGCNSKTNHFKYLKFSPNIYVSVIYIQIKNTTLNRYLKILPFLILRVENLIQAYNNCKRT
ncbi:Uncharacterized protein FWK35_00001988 [Aphis craccivora]|uniref:Uncharacterized protein n=1 Tax=Aphis craccivora TaxID=307492 RepID=A0A6G0ZR86_APHCR|nr:Uncharacterized protein FWK35_00001988 [Aphis craccivora]